MPSQLVTAFTNYLTAGFFQRLSERFNINIEDVLQCWADHIHDDTEDTIEIKAPASKSSISAKPTRGAEPTQTETLDEGELPDNLEGMKIAELRELCRARGHKVAGNKAALIGRLMGKEPPKLKAPPSKPTKPPKQTSAPVPTVDIVVNAYGNYIHEPTGIVFSANEEKIEGVSCRCAIGYQAEDGEVEELDSAHMDICKQYNFHYKFPENFE